MLAAYGEVGEFWYDLFFNEPKRVFVRLKGLHANVSYINFNDFSNGRANKNSFKFWKDSKKIIPLLAPLKGKHTDFQMVRNFGLIS